MANRCEHYWHYEHTIWQARQNDNNSVAVGRYCGKCGKMETATASKWRSIPSAYVDMRKTLKASFNS